MIFVFGSNLAGIHGAGAARYAFENLGAEWGVGEGFTGSCYALPTKDYEIECLPWELVRNNIQTFVETARNSPKINFELTPVGTGLAGHSRALVWRTLRDLGIPSNVKLSSTWVTG